jgi:Protein of unknown function (DUF1353)
MERLGARISVRVWAFAFGLSVMQVVSWPVSAVAQEKFGKFSGPILLELLPDGRDMKVVRGFTYVDPNNVTWMVPKGAVTNGATIPSALWSIVGGPREGKYRDAAVVHDHFCTTQERPFRQGRCRSTNSQPAGCSPHAAAEPRDSLDEETTDWRAVCGKTARTVRRAGRVKPSRPPLSRRLSVNGLSWLS